MTRSRAVVGCSGIKGGGGMQGSSGVDLQEPRNVATLCNPEAAGVKHTDSIPEKDPYSTFSGTHYQNAEKHKL